LARAIHSEVFEGIDMRDDLNDLDATIERLARLRNQILGKVQRDALKPCASCGKAVKCLSVSLDLRPVVCAYQVRGCLGVIDEEEV